MIARLRPFDLDGGRICLPNLLVSVGGHGPGIHAAAIFAMDILDY